MPRWLVYTSAGVLLCAAVVCFLAAGMEWGDRLAMINPDPTEASEQAGFVLEIGAIGALNLVACVAVLLVRLRATWWAAVVLQVVVLVVALVEGYFTDPPGWVFFSSVPLGTLLLLVVAPYAKVKLSDGERATTA